jgi:hypothetical protein
MDIGLKLFIKARTTIYKNDVLRLWFGRVRWVTQATVRILRARSVSYVFNVLYSPKCARILKKYHTVLQVDWEIRNSQSPDE